MLGSISLCVGFAALSTSGLAQSRRTSRPLDRAEIVRSDERIVRARLQNQLHPISAALATCRGSDRDEPITVVLQLGVDGDVIDTVRHGADRDETLERCVRDALVDWRPGPDVGSGVVEIRSAPIRSAGRSAMGSVASMMALIGNTPGGAIGHIGSGQLVGRGGIAMDPQGTGTLTTRPAVRTSWSSIASAGPIDARTARRVLDTGMASVEWCASSDRSAVSRRRELRLRMIVAAGVVQAVEALQSTTGSSTLDGCVARALRRLRFAAADSAETQVTATLAIEPIAAPRARPARRRAPSRR